MTGASASPDVDQPRVARVRAEYRSDSPWVASDRPRLSWRIETSRRGWLQESALIEIARGGTRRTFEVASEESVFVAWPNAPLRPREEVEVRVRVVGRDGSESGWSEPLSVRAGFVDDWRAPFLALAEPPAPAAPFLARTEITVDRQIRSAVLYSTAEGLCRLSVNGVRVDDHELSPGWTSYPLRLIHETADVTALLRPGRNAIGATVAGGWFTERYGFGDRATRVYGERAAFSAELVIEYEDGTIAVSRTSADWRLTAAGPLLASGIYLGEHYDARREPPGWELPGFDPAGWAAPRVVATERRPVARSAPPVRAVEELPVQEVVRSEPGRVLLDFGQNLVGHLRITVRGEAGERYLLRHAEVLEHGELGTRPLRAASSADSYVCRGGGPERWEPAFTYHGFRYAEIVGGVEAIDPADVVAIVVHTDMERIGRFRSSHPLVDRLHENVVWSMRGNFVSLPTDCPQRDERMGWTGDIQVFGPTGSALYDCDGLLASWLEDLALEQGAAGGVPLVVPDVLSSAGFPVAAWGDVATVLPATLYERFGDRGVLERQFASMRDWVEQFLDAPESGRTSPDRLWAGRFQFGDWLDPTAPPGRPWEARTDPDLVAGAYLFRSLRLVAEAATALGMSGEAERYARLAEEVREAWNELYVTGAGRLVSDTPTAYALALRFGIVLDDALRSAHGARLAELVRGEGYRVSTGFVGTPIVLDALVETGHVAAAGRMLRETELPSWLYPVRMGATTIWERWDSMLPDGSINPGDMTSFNHYAFGAVGDWLHRVLAGLGPDAPGYRRIRIAPTPVPGIDAAAFELDTPYGRAAVAWSVRDGRLEVTAVVPPNTTAHVQLPGRDPMEAGSGEHAWTVDDPRRAPRAAAVSRELPAAELVDDEEAYLTLLAAARSVDPDLTLGGFGPWLPDRPLGSGFFAPRPEVLAAIDAALRRLRDQRG